MNKFDLINRVLVSILKPEDKALLVELIMRADANTWECFPSVERLCQARGMKHEKNFKGVDVYLPGLVTKRKRGRRNLYTLNVKGIGDLERASVVIKHTPSLAADSPALAADAPSREADLPGEAGANSSMNTTKDTSRESTREVVAVAPTLVTSNNDARGGSELDTLSSPSCSEDEVKGAEVAGVRRPPARQWEAWPESWGREEVDSYRFYVRKQRWSHEEAVEVVEASLAA